MKKLISILLTLLLAVCAVACIAPEKETATPTVTEKAEASDLPVPSVTGEPLEPVELIIFAAASMTETLTEIAELYKTVAPHVTLTFSFESSGTLLTQIREGAEADIFISAAQKQMNAIDIAADADKNPDGSDYVLSDTRFDLVENRIALVVPNGNPANIHSFEDLIAANSIALGNSDVPVGQYSEELLTNMGAWTDELKGKTTFGGNVKEVTTWVAEGVVDCGIVYATDAVSAKLEIVAYAPDGAIKTLILYPAAVLNTTKHQAEAIAFLNFLKTQAAADIFRRVGFAIPPYTA